MVHTLALLAARDFIKQELKREGHIINQFSVSELIRLARDYLEANRSRLIDEARQRIAASAMFKAMWEKEGRKYERVLAAWAKRQAKEARLFTTLKI